MINKFTDVALLITHFNRSNSLERLLSSFHDMNVKFGQIVISDDFSSIEHIDKINELGKKYEADIVLAERNGGLGNNINKGQDAVSLPFTLYVQEDFVPKASFLSVLKNSVEYLKNETDLDIVRFYAYRLYPYLVSYGGGFGIMNFTFFSAGYRKFYAYSDHPHLRRSSFFDRFGRYKEGLDPEKTEYRMMMSFLKKRGRGLYYIKHKSLFDHGNTEDEPSTMTRIKITRSENIFISIIRNAYRHIKFNMNYLFSNYD